MGAEGGSPGCGEAIQHARAAIWALRPRAELNGPDDLLADIKKYQNEMKAVLVDGYLAPRNRDEERALQKRVLDDEKKVARMLLTLRDVLEELEVVAEERDRASKRWQANYDFMLARLLTQLVFLYEYQSLLGSLRQEFPKCWVGFNGWSMVPAARLRSDFAGLKLDKQANKLYHKILKVHPGTPWAVLARRQKLTAAGLEWRAAHRNPR